MVITIPNWNKFNPRSDRANYSWFRVNNDFFDELFALSNDQKILFLFLLTRASKKNCPEIEFDEKYASAILRLSERAIHKCIHELIDLGVIMTAESRQSASLLPATRRNETNVTNETRRNERIVSVALEQVQHNVYFHSKTENPILIGLLKDVKPDVQAAWIAAYTDEDWIIQEILKAHAWIVANPKKAPKNFSRFMTSWLSRGWERYRKTLDSNNPNTAYKGISEILKEQALEEYGYAV